MNRVRDSMPGSTPATPPPPPATSRRRRIALWLGASLLLLSVTLIQIEQAAWAVGIGRLGLAFLGLLAAIWLFRIAWRRLLWRVGRRLAFSYFLVGMLPLGLLALLGGLVAYLLGGFLLGHLFRDAVSSVRLDLLQSAAAHLAESSPRAAPVLADGALAYADYYDGRWTDGSDAAPEQWPAWLESEAATNDATAVGTARRPAYVALADGSIALAAGVRSGRRATLVWTAGDLSELLRQRTRAWVGLMRSDAEGGLPITRLQLARHEFTLRGLRLERTGEELDEYYRLDPPAAEEPRLLERPFLVWMERIDELPSLSGEVPPDLMVAASLAVSPRGLFRQLLSTSKRVDSSAWIALLGVSVLLFEIWIVAAGVALFMIVGLSRAVNRLSKVTEAIAGGDFSVRIQVRRRDQLGELQRSFNTMSERLQELVHTAAQKEAIDQELALARRVQRDLLPDLIETRAGVEVATMFEPSAAIGGDYYDVLARPGDRLGVVIADVAGHGLAAGLRMAMVKSALTILAEEPLSSIEIIGRLHRLLRNRTGERGFVTLTIAELDPSSGELELTNAGHPPCYVVRRAGTVEEIALPSSPLGGLPGPPASDRTRLSPGDGVVWLSDGIPECCSSAGEPFGYERIPGALAGKFDSAADLRDRLLAALRAHCGDAPVSDDRTLVALRYAPDENARPSAA